VRAAEGPIQDPHGIFAASNRRPPPAGQSNYQRYGEDYQEYKEQYLGNARRSRRDATESKEGGNDRDNQKY
jgi:hypothetical protein